MKILDEKMMKNLSFPDFEIEKMEFLPQEKTLRIFVEGAWLDLEGGIKLGRGILFFIAWENLSVSLFDPITEKWSKLDEVSVECLKELCEMKFSNSTIYLCGFGEKKGQWMEWKIDGATMHAEFD